MSQKIRIENTSKAPIAEIEELIQPLTSVAESISILFVEDGKSAYCLLNDITQERHIVHLSTGFGRRFPIESVCYGNCCGENNDCFIHFQSWKEATVHIVALLSDYLKRKAEMKREWTVFPINYFNEFGASSREVCKKLDEYRRKNPKRKQIVICTSHLTKPTKSYADEFERINIFQICLLPKVH